jgi:hypothetical protein
MLSDDFGIYFIVNSKYELWNGRIFISTCIFYLLLLLLLFHNIIANLSYIGLSVALVEKEDFACGTSSRSTKLIHGGGEIRQLSYSDWVIIYNGQW